MTSELSALLKLGASMPGEPEVDRPRPERLIDGNPRRETWNVVDAPLAPGSRLYCGVWRCEPGHWRIAFGPHEHELFTVLAGRCRVHGADGSVCEVGPGEALALAPGFQGSFEVIEPLTKSYAIVDVA
ncbi:cupin domain-containing protein [Ideonella sp. A 288]|uniref:cupin domain-containing protein n=1 Tax=Ideonella sp. A 288 TaxID=1962181 RepID=UPI000B4C1B24|nr:cupin domain-containing protein [Ideonella sp. A 288]